MVPFGKFSLCQLRIWLVREAWQGDLDSMSVIGSHIVGDSATWMWFTPVGQHAELLHGMTVLVSK